MHQKQTSQSKALENLVERTPVKEREKLYRTQQSIEKPNKLGIGYFSQARLNLEIAGYWMLSKYAQAKRRHLEIMEKNSRP